MAESSPLALQRAHSAGPLVTTASLCFAPPCVLLPLVLCFPCFTPRAATATRHQTAGLPGRSTICRHAARGPLRLSCVVAVASTALMYSPGQLCTTRRAHYQPWLRPQGRSQGLKQNLLCHPSARPLRPDPTNRAGPLHARRVACACGGGGDHYAICVRRYGILEPSGNPSAG